MDSPEPRARPVSVNNAARIKRLSWFIPLLALLSVAGYVVATYLWGEPGFPLDDAWIHQTYARNLAETGQLAYLPGQPSAGSTSPAWSYLLSVGYLLGVDHLLWAYLLGGLCLAVSAWLAYRIALRLAPSRTKAALLTGLFCAVEWHLVWAAASGMETMLFTALTLALLQYYFSQLAERQAQDGPMSLRAERLFVGAVGIGLIAGALIATRPEGLGLAGLVIIALLVFPASTFRTELRNRLLTTGVSLLGMSIIVAPYIYFNLQASGSIFPNTFYAKQAEYQVYLQALPLLARLWKVVSPTLVGAQALLLPGFCYAAYRLIRRRHWPDLLPLMWWLAFIIVYAWRLPVDYQHGRYTIPTIPILVIYGIWGTAEILRPRSTSLIIRTLSRAMPIAIGLLAIVFWARGALAYRDDVAFIQGEMAATAQWLDEHTNPNDTIAVHDIGAVGFMTDRPLLDLAGLISPDVIPFIADPQQLAEWMIESEAAYVVMFPDFSPAYAQLVADPRLEKEYCTDYAWTQSVGHENLCVYRLTPVKQP